MSEILTINTEESVIKQNDATTPLPLYGEDYEMLSRVMPEYTEPLPNPGMTRLIQRLKQTMLMHNGIGLSANQCGAEVRVFVIGTKEFQLACINPKIVKESVEISKMREGCLSYPGLFLFVDRHDTIEVEYVNEQGETVTQLMQGITAQCFQHELDHMNGVKLAEHVGPLALSMAKKRRDKMMKKLIKGKV
jgi:peptide deformylase